jgi:hypothetical protein
MFPACMCVERGHQTGAVERDEGRRGEVMDDKEQAAGGERGLKLRENMESSPSLTRPEDRNVREGS